MKAKQSAVETITTLWSCFKCKHIWWSKRSPSKCPKCGVKPGVSQPDGPVKRKRKSA